MRTKSAFVDFAVIAIALLATVFYFSILLICGVFTGAAICCILNVLYSRTEKIINVKAK